MGLAENLKQLRKTKRWGQTKLADEAKVSQQLISRLENGIDLTTKKLPEIARALGVTVFDIDENYAPDIAASEPIAKAALFSWVSAGGLASNEADIDWENAKPINVPGVDPLGKWIALIVEGDSMNKISPPGSLIAVNLLDTRLAPNACYVIATEDGAASYKRYRPGKKQWHPVSTNKRHKALTPKEVAGATVIGRVRKTMLDM